uniref:Uncharacterized protein n=1 Tax=Oryza sativa subsp. japonica TaxID=39947 RepID=Q5VMG5_ORYSJ|nr:hypothetical protein [Oryza sativa Japonica Group]
MVADVIKGGGGRRRQAGPTGQRHKGEGGSPWTGTTRVVHRQSTGPKAQIALGADRTGGGDPARLKTGQAATATATARAHALPATATGGGDGGAKAAPTGGGAKATANGRRR